MFSHCGRRQVFSENASDLASLSVAADDLAPSSSELRVVFNIFSLEDVDNSLSHVVAGIFLVRHSLDFQKSLMFSLLTLSSAEANEDGTCVKSTGKRGVFT